MSDRELPQTSRLPLPAALIDQAFITCVHESFEMLELFQQFDRLYGATLATKPTETCMHAFTGFVHDCIYLRLPDEAITSLRAAAESASKGTGEKQYT